REGSPIVRKPSEAMEISPGRAPRYFVLLGPSTKISEFLDDKAPYFWASESNDPAEKKPEASDPTSGAWATIRAKDIREVPATATTEMEVGQYDLSQLLVLRPVVERNAAPGERLYEVLVTTRSPFDQRTGGRDGRPANGGNPERLREGAF